LDSTAEVHRVPVRVWGEVSNRLAVLGSLRAILHELGKCGPCCWPSCMPVRLGYVANYINSLEVERILIKQ
jgi:hypothetical protein